MFFRVRDALWRPLLNTLLGCLRYLRLFAIGCQQRVRILRATEETIDAVVKVVRRADSIARVSDIPKDGSRLNDGSRFYVGESVKVGVVMPLPARTEDANNVTTQAVFANLEDHAVSCTQHRTTERGEDVDPLVTSIVAAWSAPSVGELL